MGKIVCPQLAPHRLSLCPGGFVNQPGFSFSNRSGLLCTACVPRGRLARFGSIAPAADSSHQESISPMSKTTTQATEPCFDPQPGASIPQRMCPAFPATFWLNWPQSSGNSRHTCLLSNHFQVIAGHVETLAFCTITHSVVRGLPAPLAPIMGRPPRLTDQSRSVGVLPNPAILSVIGKGFRDSLRPQAKITPGLRRRQPMLLIRTTSFQVSRSRRQRHQQMPRPGEGPLLP